MMVCVVVLVAGCAATREVRIKEGLGLFESLLPIAPDSVIGLYARFDPTTFHSSYKTELAFARHVMDSLNAQLDEASRIDTLAIDHALENFGNAARSRKTLYISSSYFFLFNDLRVIRSVLTHEYGHIFYDQLTMRQREALVEIWGKVQERALFYLFRDGEYSENARFGGHPDESPEELFASAFNLFHNKAEELRARLLYVDPAHHHLIRSLEQLVLVRERGR